MWGSWSEEFKYAPGISIVKPVMSSYAATLMNVKILSNDTVGEVVSWNSWTVLSTRWPCGTSLSFNFSNSPVSVFLISLKKPFTPIIFV